MARGFEPTESGNPGSSRGARSTPGPAQPPATSTGSAVVDAAEGQRLVAAGRSQFLRCNSCHVVDADAPPPFGDDLGPHLEGIVGRPAARVADFEYTESLRALDLVWDEATLDDWLEHPQAPVPDLCIPFMDIPKAAHRRALIAYLKDPVK